MPSRPVPAELCDMIIDNLCDDHCALIACSLACRAWVPRTRRYLFETVELRGNADSIQLKRLLDASSAASTGISLLFRVLIIDNEGPDLLARFEQSLGVRRATSQTDWLDCWVPQLLPMLVNIESLTLGTIVWTSNSGGLREETKRCILTFSPRIKALCLKSLTFWRSGDMMQLFCAYPRLASLKIDFIDILDKRTHGLLHARPDRDATIQLRELTSYTRDTSIVSACLQRGPFDLHLRKLQWELRCNSRSNECLALEGLLRRAGSSLKHLQVRLNDKDDQLDLSRNTQLASIDIIFWITQHKFPVFLSQINSTCLKEITFRFRSSMHYDDDPDSIVDWARMDDVLAQLGRRSPGLAVKLYMTYAVLDTEWATEVVDDIAVRLPLVRAARMSFAVVCEGSTNNIVLDGGGYDQTVEHLLIYIR
ncbi:hypothetical protein AcW1_001821 [Taiwanofungus camphoratus]|nr:hypothetical protein AcW1_001821 [Antrodia cinnamomea]